MLDQAASCFAGLLPKMPSARFETSLVMLCHRQVHRDRGLQDWAAGCQSSWNAVSTDAANENFCSRACIWKHGRIIDKGA